MTTTAVDIIVKTVGTSQLDQLDRKLTSVDKQAKKTSSAIAGLVGSFGKLAALAGVSVGIGAAFDQIRKADKAAAGLRSLGADTKELVPALAKVRKELGNNISQAELSDSAFQVLQSGFKKTKDVTDILAASTVAAKAKFADTAVVTKALTSVLNSYGIQADKSGEVTNKFFKTIKDGNLTIEEYSSIIGGLAPLGNSAGVSLEQLNAGLARITQTGSSAGEAATGLQAIIRGIIAPSAQATKLAESLGLEFNESALKAKGLSGVLTDVIEKTGGSSEAITTLFGSVEALTAILALAGDEFEGFNKALKNQGSTSNDVKKAFDENANTITAALKRIENAYTGLVAKESEVGGTIIPILDTITLLLESLDTPLGAVVIKVAAVTAGIVLLKKAFIALKAVAILSFFQQQIALLITFGPKIYAAATATNVLTAAQVKLAGALSATNLAAAAFAAKVSLIALPFIGVGLAIEDNRRRVEEFEEALKSVDLDTITSKLNELVKEKKQYEEILKSLENSTYYQGLASDIQDAKDRVKELEKQIDQATRRRQLVIDIIAKVADIKNEVEQRAREAGGRAKGFDTLTAAQLQEGIRLAGGGGGGISGSSGGSGGGGGGGSKPQDDTERAQDRLRALREELALAEAKNNVQRRLLQITFSYDNVLREIEKYKGISPQLRQDLQLQAELTRQAKEQRAILDGAVEPALRRTAAFMEAIRPIQQENELLQAQLDGREDEVRLNQQVLELKRQFPEADEAGLRSLLEQNKALKDRVDKMNKMKELMKSIVESVATAIEDSIVAAIDSAVSGAKDLGQALQEIASSLLKDVGRMLLRTGINSLMPTFAAGGRPEVGRASIVGENGPEIFIPDSAGRIDGSEAFNAARQAMTTSSAVQSSTAALDREQEQIEMMNNPSPLDVRFETYSIGGMDVVTREEAMKISEQSAKKARAQVFADMRNKPATRAQLGIG